VKAEIHLKYTDGTEEKILTDESWFTAPGPVVRNNVYLGERYDARLEILHWNEEPFDGSKWSKAKIADGPVGYWRPIHSPIQLRE
jgi:alpha-L-rhamnosidase